jgi:GNAT superfamily N-acetyltransferase
MQNMKIRVSRPADLMQIIDLYQYFGNHDSPQPTQDSYQKIWQEIQDDPHQVYIVAENDGKLISTCFIVFIPNMNHAIRPFGLIENVVTHPDYRGKGVATGVLHYALTLAWERNCYKVMLMTGSKKEETLRFYEKAGFKKGIKTGFIAYPPA